MIIFQTMDSDSDNEIFFGRVTEKEEKIAQNIRNRRTEIFEPGGPLFQRQSSVYVMYSYIFGSEIIKNICIQGWGQIRMYIFIRKYCRLKSVFVFGHVYLTPTLGMGPNMYFYLQMQ